MRRLVNWGVPALFAVLGSLFVWDVGRDKLRLEYSITESAEFPSGTKVARFFAVKFVNSGNRKIDSISFEVAFTAPVVESVRVTEVGLASQVRQAADHVSGILPLLNPDESVTLTVTTVGLPSGQGPSVAARAPGATATRLGAGNERQGTTVLLGLAVFAAATIAWLALRASSRANSSIKDMGNVKKMVAKTGEAASARLRRQESEFEASVNKARKEEEERRRRHEASMREMEERARAHQALMAEEERKRQEYARRQAEGEPKTEQVVFSVLSRAGLGHVFFEVAAGGDITYWRTGVFLVRGFLVAGAERDHYVRALEILISSVPEDRISPSSKGFLMYFLGKMEKARGNTSEAVAWLDRCKKETPLMFEHVMAQDPAYDLEELSGRLRDQQPVS